MKHARTMMDWDGAPLGDEVVIDLEIEWEEEPVAKLPGALLEEMIRRASHKLPGPPLEEAIRRASREEDGRRGIVIEGAPGSGKSVLSHVLEQRLQQPPFDALGIAVRRGARELAVAIEGSPDAPLGQLPSGSHRSSRSSTGSTS